MAVTPKEKFDLPAEIAKMDSEVQRMRNRPIRERIDFLSQMMGAILDKAGRLPPDLKEKLRKKKH
jgi:hypothetical protein